MSDYQEKTPGKVSTPEVSQLNDQGQGSCYKGGGLFRPGVKLDEWGPDRSGKKPGDPE